MPGKTFLVVLSKNGCFPSWRCENLKRAMKKTSRRTERQSVGRPRTFDQDEAIEVAMQAFWSRGFGATSAGDLADAMSIQRSSFYNAFGDRERVFAAALQRYASELPAAVLGRISPDVALTPVLVTMFREVCRIRACDAEARGCMMVNSIAELIGTNKHLGPVLAKGVEESLVLVDRLLRHAVARGEMKEPADFNASARSFIAFLMGLNLLAKVVRSEAELWLTCRVFLVGMGFDVPPDGAQEACETVHRRKRRRRHA